MSLENEKKADLSAMETQMYNGKRIESRKRLK